MHAARVLARTRGEKVGNVGNDLRFIGDTFVGEIRDIRHQRAAVFAEWLYLKSPLGTRDSGASCHGPAVQCHGNLCLSDGMRLLRAHLLESRPVDPFERRLCFGERNFSQVV